MWKSQGILFCLTCENPGKVHGVNRISVISGVLLKCLMENSWKSVCLDL